MPRCKQVNRNSRSYLPAGRRLLLAISSHRADKVIREVVQAGLVEEVGDGGHGRGAVESSKDADFFVGKGCGGVRCKK